MSNHVRAPVDPKLRFSSMSGSSGVASFDWDSGASFSDRKSGISEKVRSGSMDNTKRLVAKNPSGAMVLGKFQISLAGGQETCVVSYQCHLSHECHTRGTARAELHLLPGASKVSELLSGKDLGSGTAF